MTTAGAAPSSTRQARRPGPRPIPSLSGPPRSPPTRDVPLPARFLEITATRAEPVRIREARDVETQRRLDAMMTASQGPYRTPDGKVLRVGIPFRMTNPYEAQKITVPQHMADLAAAAKNAHLPTETLNRIECGRGTPEEIRALTQSLLDHQPAGKAWDKTAVQSLMFDHGIGIDCAGYVQQAYLLATGTTRLQANLGGATTEDLSGLARKGFSRIDDGSDVRPGDVVVLGPKHPEDPRDVGHRTIVFDQRLATAADMHGLVQSSEPAAREFSVGGPIRVFEVDSSWGSGGNPEIGGVKRETWLYNESTKLWGYRDWQDGTFTTGRAPYDHPLDGFYRKGS